jgi:hypothetical protein
MLTFCRMQSPVWGVAGSNDCERAPSRASDRSGWPSGQARGPTRVWAIAYFALARKVATFAEVTTSVPVSVIFGTVPPLDSVSSISIEPTPIA